jgi:prepilin-type N-terminal cleavage/methylation domain-containing protein
MLNQKGFTLIEILISIFIITIGVVGVFSTIVKYSQMTQEEKDHFEASYLAQEGIEIVKNIRDTNWIEGAASWKDGLTGCLWSSDGRYIYLNSHSGGTGMYEYIATPQTGDIKTIFKRMITILEIEADQLDIVVDVYWNDKKVTVRENIFNWK